MQYYAMLYCTVLYYTMLNYTRLYYTTLYYTILYNTILYYTTLYFSALAHPYPSPQVYAYYMLYAVYDIPYTNLCSLFHLIFNTNVICFYCLRMSGTKRSM